MEKGSVQRGVISLTRFFFNCYLAALRPTLGHSQGDSVTNPMLITAFVHIGPKSHREPRNEVGSLSPAKCLAGFETGTFLFLLERLNPLGHSPRLISKDINRNILVSFHISG